MAKADIAKSIYDGIDNFAKNVQWNGKSILKGNEAINPLKSMGKFVLGETNTGVRGTLKAMSKGDDFTKALGKAYKNAGTESIKGLGDVNWKAVGGTYVGVAAAGRVLTGGGVYRDSTGNPNLPVVPFV